MPSDTVIIAKIISSNPKVEIRKIIDGIKTQVSNSPSVIKKGIKEIEKLEVNKPMVSSKEISSIKKIEKEQEIVKMLNYGPIGSKGDKGDKGDIGPAGTLDNFEIPSDLSEIFTERLKRNR